MGSTHELSEKKNGCTNHNVTLNSVVILGMGLRLRCIHRLSTKYTFILVSQFLFIEIVGPDGPDLKYLVMGPKLYVEWA